MTTETLRITESAVEETALIWLENLGYSIASGASLMDPDSGPDRSGYDQVILENHMKQALVEINPSLPPSAIDEAIRQIKQTFNPNPIENNRFFHRLLTDGITVPIIKDGIESHDQAWLLDLDHIENNHWLAVNQFSVMENRRTLRPDIVIFINGLPLAIIELKNPADETSTLFHAFNQLQAYKEYLPGLLSYNELLVISDGLQARVGTLTSGWDRYMPWRTIDGTEPAPKGSVELETLLKGLFEKHRLLDYILNFIVFDDDGHTIAKKAAGYHQYHAVNKAVACAFSACGFPFDPQTLTGRFPKFRDEIGRVKSPQVTFGNKPGHFGGRRIGVIWHTQGSGKSLLMAFFAGKIIRHPGMKNPTLVVITDRNDLDDQLFKTFSGCKELLRQTPMQAANREELRGLLRTPAGGVIFTTIQKFFPLNKGEPYPVLSDRENIIVIADEAHRSQYDFIDGFARHMHDALPYASFIGFTGTPIEKHDRSTPAVFGDYIDTYDIKRAVEDGATVPIYYEGRLAKIELVEEEKPKIDPEFEEITEGQEESEKQRLQAKWARLEAMVGTEKRLDLVARDLLRHFDQRLEALEGKGMIVCMSRRICVDMYKIITRMRPNWHHPEDDKGTVKVVMSGSIEDDNAWLPHIRSKYAQETIAKRFKDPDNDLKLVIVRDMWLTGFDCPSLHTMYIDKPMQGHGLMQTIARVNRVFKDKRGGLVVDYIGIADHLRRAVNTYTEAGGQGTAAYDIETAVSLMKEKYEILLEMLHGFDFRPYTRCAADKRLSGLLAAGDYILGIDGTGGSDGKKKFIKAVTELSQAFALSVPHEETYKIRDHLAFFQEIRNHLYKTEPNEPGKPKAEMDTALRQLVSRAVSSDEVVDIFAAVGLKKPDISILTDEFIREIQQLPYKNLALELLKKLLYEEISLRSRKNMVRAKTFSQMLEETIRLYQNRSIDTAQVIEELLHVGKEIRESYQRDRNLNLSEDEIAFYEALEVNDSAVKILGDETLKKIARELVKEVRNSVSIDWTVRENARANIRVKVKRILRKFGYPPDKQEKATQTVLSQAEVLCEEWLSGE